MLALLTLACTLPPEEGDTAEPASVLATALGEGEGELDAAKTAWRLVLGEDEKLTDPRDLGFDPDGNLWVANRADDRTFIVFDPGTDDQSHERRKDGYAEHFMEETAAMSFEGTAGASLQYGNEFGTCGESENTYNDRVRGDKFMGPVLWTTDLDIFAEENPMGLGSHLDMLHQSPLCVGIAWERDNVYWVFDGYNSNIVRYDFRTDHDVGQDDHSDGIVYRLSEPTVTRVEDAPGHMVIDPSTGLLYVADTGGGRVLRLDTQSGEQGADLRTRNEPLDTYAEWDGVDWTELVTGLDRPGGIALGNGVLYVGEYGTGRLHAFDLDGNPLQVLDADLGEGALYGIEVGPDGALWVVDLSAPGVFRLEPGGR